MTDLNTKLNEKNVEEAFCITEGKTMRLNTKSQRVVGVDR